MRKVLVSVLLLGLVAGAMSAVPAAAKKKKKTATVKEEFSIGPLAPMPVASDVEPNGCRNGQEGAQKTTIPFTTPGKGVMSVEIHDFQGDWDLFLMEGGNVVAASDASQLTGDAPTEQIMIPLGAKKNVEIVACNWGGGPLAAGSYTYKYKK